MRSDRAVVDCLNCIGVEIYRVSKNRVWILDVRLEIARKKIGAFLGQDTEQLFEWLERCTEVEVYQCLTVIEQLI